MKQILEKLDLSSEIKDELQQSIDEAVLVEATKLAESKEEAYEEYMFEQLTEMKSNLEDTLDAYLEKVVEQFVKDNTFAIDESIKSEKYSAVLEGFNSLLLTTGVGITQIAEAKEKEDEIANLSEGKVDESAREMADKLMAENIELKNTNSELLKTGLIRESMEGMTPVQKDKFTKLVSVVEFDASKAMDFIEKVDTIVESVKGEKEVKEEPKVTGKVITESVYTSTASHLF